MATFKINFRSLHIQIKLFIKTHCPTPMSRSEFLTLRTECLKYQGAYIKQKYNLNSLLLLYCYEQPAVIN